MTFSSVPKKNNLFDFESKICEIFPPVKTFVGSEGW